MPKNRIKNQEQALQVIVSLIKDNTSIRPSAYSVNGVDDRGELVLSLEDHDGNEFSISLDRSGYGTVIVFPNDFSDKNRNVFMFSVQGERQWRDYADNVYNEHLEEWDVQRKQPSGADIPDVMDGEEVNVNAIQNIDNFIRNNGVVGNEKGVALGDILSVSLKNGSSLQLADLHYPDGNVSTIYFMHDNEHNSQSFVYDKSKLVEGVKNIDGHHINEVAGMMSEAINIDREVSEAQAEPLNWDEKKYYTSSSFIGRTEDEMEHFDTMRTEKDVNSLLSYAKDYEASNSNKVNLGQTYSQPHLTKSDMVIAENDDYAVSYDPSDMPLAYVMYRKVSEGEIRDVIAESNARGYDNSYDSEVVRDIRSKMEREEKALVKQSFYAFMTDATPDFIDGISKDASANEIINSLVEATDAVDESNDVEKEGYLATDIHTEYGSSYAENSKYVIGFDPNDIEFGGNYNLYQKINGLEAKKILLAQGYKESEILNFFKNFLGNDSAFREAVSEGSEVSKNLNNAQSEKQESKQVKTYYAFLGEVDEDLLDTSLADSVNTQTIMGIAHGVIPDKTPITVPNVFVSPGDVFAEDKEYVLGFDVGDKADSYNFYRKLSEKDFMGLLLNHGYNEQEAKEYIKDLDLAAKTHAKEVAGKKEENQKEQASEKKYYALVGYPTIEQLGEIGSNLSKEEVDRTLDNATRWIHDADHFDVTEIYESPLYPDGTVILAEDDDYAITHTEGDNDYFLYHKITEQQARQVLKEFGYSEDTLDDPSITDEMKELGERMRAEDVSEEGKRRNYDKSFLALMRHLDRDSLEDYHPSEFLNVAIDMSSSDNDIDAAHTYGRSEVIKEDDEDRVVAENDDYCLVFNEDHDDYSMFRKATEQDVRNALREHGYTHDETRDFISNTVSNLAAKMRVEDREHDKQLQEKYTSIHPERGDVYDIIDGEGCERTFIVHSVNDNIVKGYLSKSPNGEGFDYDHPIETEKKELQQGRNYYLGYHAWEKLKQGWGETFGERSSNRKQNLFYSYVGNVYPEDNKHFYDMFEHKDWNLLACASAFRDDYEPLNLEQTTRGLPAYSYVHSGTGALDNTISGESERYAVNIVSNRDMEGVYNSFAEVFVKMTDKEVLDNIKILTDGMKPEEVEQLINSASSDIKEFLEDKGFAPVRKEKSESKEESKEKFYAEVMPIYRKNGDQSEVDKSYASRIDVLKGAGDTASILDIASEIDNTDQKDFNLSSVFLDLYDWKKVAEDDKHVVVEGADYYSVLKKVTEKQVVDTILQDGFDSQTDDEIVDRFKDDERVKFVYGKPVQDVIEQLKNLSEGKPSDIENFIDHGADHDFITHREGTEGMNHLFTFDYKDDHYEIITNPTKELVDPELGYGRYAISIRNKEQISDVTSTIHHVDRDNWDDIATYVQKSSEYLSMKDSELVRKVRDLQEDSSEGIQFPKFITLSDGNAYVGLTEQFGIDGDRSLNLIGSDGVTVRNYDGLSFADKQAVQNAVNSIKRPTFVKDLSPLEKNVYDLVSKPSSLNDVKVNHIDADKGTWYSFGDGTRDYDYFVADEKLRVNDILRVHDPKTGFSNQVLDASLAEWLSENIPNIRPVAKQEQQPIPREENHEQYISVGENKDSLSNLSTGGRWHNAVINELRVYQRYGEILTDWKNMKDHAPLKSSHYVPDNNPVKALVMSVWSSMHDYKHPVYLSAREVEQQGLMVRKGSLGIPVFDKGTSQIEDYYNIDQTNFKLLAEQSTVLKEKYDSILKDAADYLYQGRKYLRDVDNLANDGKWVVPVVIAADWEVAERFKYDNNSDAPSAIYDRDKDEIVVLKEDYDGSIPDSRTDEILGSLTDSLLVGDRISQKSAHDSNYYSFAKLMNFIRYDISMDYVKDKEISFLTFSNRHNAEFNRFRDDPQYTKDVLETAARVSDTIFSKSQGMDITLDNQKAEAEQQSQQQSYGISEAKPEQEQEEIQHRGIHF